MQRGNGHFRRGNYWRRWGMSELLGLLVVSSNNHARKSVLSVGDKYAISFIWYLNGGMGMQLN